MFFERIIAVLVEISVVSEVGKAVTGVQVQPVTVEYVAVENAPDEVSPFKRRNRKLVTPPDDIVDGDRFNFVANNRHDTPDDVHVDLTLLVENRGMVRAIRVTMDDGL